ncbi:excalibur calcium-binding domain-containing protein [Deinococcus radiophilus]|uniref:excalibur calcium-binding domain-containing protein n=1 Tax=Deinococcus radiophilus TaxID=32062 RepID=UPI003608C521
MTIPASFFKMWTDGQDYRLWVMPNVAINKLTGQQYGQYEVSIKQLQTYWPEFSVGLPLNAAQPGKLCPGAIPLKQIGSTPAVRPATPPRPAAQPAYLPPRNDAPYYANCAAAKAAGAAPLRRGQPGYRAAMDRDGDGVACE